MFDRKRLFDLAKQKGIEEVQIIVDSDENLELVYYEGQVEKNETSEVSSVLVSGLLNGKIAFFRIEDLDMDEQLIADELFASVSIINNEEESEIFAGSPSYPEYKYEEPDFLEVSISEKISLLAKLEQLIKEKEPRIVSIPEIEYSETVSAKQIINSKGLDVAKKNAYCYFAVEVVASDGKAPQTGFKVEVKKQLKGIEIEKIADEVIEDATSMFGAEPIESGNYPIIFENDCLVDLFARFSAMFSGEQHLKKVSPLLNKLGTKVFSDKLTIYDAPLKEDALMIETFDDEGVACYDKAVVENGVFKIMLHNLKTAKAFNSETTGNGFGGGVSPANMYIKPGERSKEELISSISKGLMLTKLDGLHAGLNPISGDFSLKTAGFYIEDGKIVKPVTLIIVTGNFLEMMNDIEDIGNDLKLDHRGIGCPSIKFKSLAISGN